MKGLSTGGAKPLKSAALSALVVLGTVLLVSPFLFFGAMLRASKVHHTALISLETAQLAVTPFEIAVGVFAIVLFAGMLSRQDG
jgi:hypothetical protein